MGYTIYSSKDCGWTWRATDKTFATEDGIKAQQTAHQMTMNLSNLQILYCARRPQDIADTSGLLEGIRSE